MKTVIINKNQFGEYEVREKNGEINYTDDKQDAIMTAKYIHKENEEIEIKFRIKKR